MRKIDSIFDRFSARILGQPLPPEKENVDWKKGFREKEEKRKKEMFKNVLAYPEGTEHLKYFDKIPHPERFSDMELALAEAFAEKDLNPPEFLKKMEFENVKEKLYPKMSTLEKKILSLPEYFDDLLRKELAKKDKNENFIIAYRHLRDCFRDYLASSIGDPNEPDIRWIDYDFGVDYAPAQKALKDLTANLWNEAAMNNLIQKLGKAGALTDKPEYVNFNLWNTDPKNWSDMSYQARSVKYLNRPVLDSWERKFLPAQYWALGDYTINALPEGRVRYVGNGEHEICLDKVYYFINDSFNFEGNEPLGPWKLKYMDNDGNEKAQLTFIDNFLLRNYRKFGYGRYFPVLSRLHEVENFTPECRRMRSGK